MEKTVCINRVSFYVPSGYDYRETLVRCGNTDPYGDRAVCDVCAANPEIVAQIMRHERLIKEDNAWLRSAGQGEM